MSYRKLFVGLNVGMLAAFVLAYALDYGAEWKPYQKKYLKMAAEALEKKAEQAKPEEAQALKAQARKLRGQGLEIKQIISKDLGRIDRCVTCHVGMDEYTNPTLANDFTQHPYKAHPKLDTLAKNHPFTKYGCTVCHQGQGLATAAVAAHGKVKHWEKPLYDGKIIQASCARCHGNFETLKGAEVAAKGRKLFYEHGCQGCHAVRGQGQIVSVDFKDIADKPLERISGFNFSRVKRDGKPLAEEDWTLQNWVMGHLTNDPMEVTPNDPKGELNPEPVAPSAMPDFSGELGQEGAEAITAFLMSLTEEDIPHRYYVPGPAPKEPAFADAKAHGKYVFEKYGCAGCHGIHGSKGRRHFNAMGPGQADPEKDMAQGRVPTLTDVVGTYTHEELVKKIANGVANSAVNRFNPEGPAPPLYMPAWKDKIKGREIEDMATWLLSVAKKEEVGF